ncbi:MAG TPA: hypothetical protein VJZ72_07605 [Candidatus Limnocylindrales bacterium]|nr:hypothetical protein [Candidatus Limnocylindrales bacterium]
MTDLLETPTNGRQPPPAAPEPPPTEPRQSPVAFSPPQLAVGAAVIAALLLIGFRRLRRRGR